VGKGADAAQKAGLESQGAQGRKGTGTNFLFLFEENVPTGWVLNHNPILTIIENPRKEGEIG